MKVITKASTNGSTSNVAAENKSAKLSETEAKKAADEKAAAEKNWNTIDEDRKQLEKDAISALEKQKSLFAREVQRISQIAKPQHFYGKLSLPRNKTHFDALLDEVQWMANDFVEERKWKIALAKKIAREAVNYVEEMWAKREEISMRAKLLLRKKCSDIASQVKDYWNRIDFVKIGRAQKSRQKNYR